MHLLERSVILIRGASSFLLPGYDLARSLSAPLCLHDSPALCQQVAMKRLFLLRAGEESESSTRARLSNRVDLSKRPYFRVELFNAFKGLFD